MGLEAQPKVWGRSCDPSEVWDGLGCPPGGLGWVKIPFQRSGTGQEAFLEVQGVLGVSSGCPGRVGRPSRRSE